MLLQLTLQFLEQDFVSFLSKQKYMRKRTSDLPRVTKTCQPDELLRFYIYI